MKKSIYSITALLIILAVGCTKFDAPTTETYAPAPEFSVVPQAAVADSSATFKLVIDKKNTTRFSVALINDKLDAAEYPDSMALLKGNVSAKKVQQFNADTLKLNSDTLSFTYPGLMPNSAYTFVAVVSNKFGMVSPVKGLSVLTSDNLAPVMTKATPGDAGSFSIAFSEPMQRGSGKITAKYYAPFDLTVTGEIDSKFINCTVNGKDVSISCDSVPAGALVLVSWEAGAFKDMKGNNCNANVTEINMTTGKIDNGCYFYVEKEPFSFSVSDVLGLGEPFIDYTVFQPTVSYEKPMFINYDENDAQPVINMFYTKDGIETKLPAQWDVNDTAIIFSFYKEMEYGSKISFTVPEGAVVDAFGNPNKEFKVNEAWMRSYGLTVDDILGVYDVQYLSAATGDVEETSMLITRSADGLQVSRLFSDNTVLSADFDGDLAILYIEDFQYMYSIEAKGYDVYFATGRDDGYAQLQYNPISKSFSSSETAEIGQYVLIPATGQKGWMDYSMEVVATYSADQSVNYPNNLMLGSYQWIFHSYFDDDPDTRDTITCTIADADTSLVIKDFYFEGNEIVAYFDSIDGKLVIPDWQFIGTYGAYDCYNSTYDLGSITFTCSPDGTAFADGNESEYNILWGIYIPDYGTNGAWLKLSEGDLILKPYTPEVTASVRAAKRSAPLNLNIR